MQHYIHHGNARNENRIIYLFGNGGKNECVRLTRFLFTVRLMISHHLASTGRTSVIALLMQKSIYLHRVIIQSGRKSTRTFPCHLKKLNVKCNKRTPNRHLYVRQKREHAI